MSAQLDENRAPGLHARIGPRAVLSLAWPLMVSRMSDTVMLAVDTIFTSHLGTDALAGVGVAISATMLVSAFGTGLLGGVRVGASHRVGAGDVPAATRLAWQGIWLAIGMGALTWLSLPFAGAWFHWITGSAEVAANAQPFFSTRVLGVPIFYGWFVLSGYFAATGDTRTPMIGTVAANLINLALNPLFVFGYGPLPSLGTAGPALATVIANGLNLSWLAWRFYRRAPRVERQLSRPLLREISRSGLPMGLDALQEIAGFALFVGFMARAGAAHIAAHVVVIRVVLFSFLPCLAIGEAGGVLVGQSIGAGRPEQARQAWRTSAGLAILLMGLSGVAFVGAPGLLLSVFNPSPEVLELGRRMLWIAAAFQIFDAIAVTSFHCLNGAGDNRFTMFINLFCGWGLKIPLAWLFASHLGLGAPGAWIGLTAEIVVAAGLYLWRTRGSQWLQSGAEGRELAHA